MASFKDSWETGATFTGGFKNPYEILIVGIDIPEEDWNRGCSDIDRLPLSMANPIDPESILATIEAGGSVPPVECAKIDGKILLVEGRRRVIACRKARDIQAKGGKTADELLEIPFIPSKGTDLQINVRRGNLGRYEDPPWVKARQVAKLRAGGKSDKTIAALYQVEIHTLGSWTAYMNLDPEIQKQVEGDPQTLTWNAAIELGRLGEGEFTKQHLVLDTIRNTGAVIKGERGRENFRRVCAAVKSGEITTAPAPAGTVTAPPGEDEEDSVVETPEAPTAAPSAGNTAKLPPLKTFDPKSKQPAHLPECAKGGCAGAKRCPAAAWNVAKAQAGSPRGGGNTKDPPALDPVPSKRTKPEKSADAIASLGLAKGGKLSIEAIRQVFANLEPLPNEPLENEGEQAVFAALAVIVGQDATGEGLAPWPYLLKCFRPALRSSLVTK